MISFDEVSVAYPMPNGEERVVLEHISFDVARGDMVYLVGPSGSGKSSLLKLIYMELKPRKGEVRVDHLSSRTVKPRQVPFLRRKLGIVFQDFQLLPDRNVFDNIAFALRATGRTSKYIRARVPHVLSHVGLSHRQKALPHELSGGEQQRVCIARAIANEPDILLADEPTGNLDPTVTTDIQKLIVGLHREGMTVVMATHDYRIVREFPARTFAFVKRQLMEVNPRTLYEDPR